MSASRAIAIHLSIVYGIFFIVFICGVVKWYQFRNHVMIQKRFPALTCFIILLAFVGSTVSTISNWIQEDNIGIYLISAASAISYSRFNLISIRLFLIYLTFKRNKEKVAENENKASTNEAVEFSKTQTIGSDKIMSKAAPNSSALKPMPARKSLYRHWLITSLIILNFVISLYTFFGETGATLWIIILSIGWFMNLCIAIIVILIVVCKKAQDGIGCTTETIIMLVFSIFMSLIGGLSMMPKMELPMLYIRTILGYLRALVLLYSALYFIYRFEGSLNAKKWRQKQSEATISSETQIKTAVDANADILKQMELPMHIFLDLDRKNYDAFKKYLVYCWSVENLLFVERACVLYQIMLNYKGVWNENDGNDKKREGIIVHNSLHRMTFKYQQSLYSEYENIIATYIKDKNDVKERDNFKIAFNKIINDIFEEFIQNGAMNEVNISYLTRGALQYVIEDNKAQKLQRFEDYLHLFDHALIEIYHLLGSMYDYQFKQWLKSDH